VCKKAAKSVINLIISLIRKTNKGKANVFNICHLWAAKAPKQWGKNLASGTRAFI